MTNPHHSNKTSQHFTPKEIVEAARRTMGGISLDPASCPEANKTVKAELIYTAEDDGLKQRWFGNVFLNPPSKDGATVRKNGETVKKFWEKLCQDYEENCCVEQAVWVGYSLEQLLSLQRCDLCVPYPLDYPFCIPRSRLKFTGSSPTHGNYLIYMGHRVNEFMEQFASFGYCRNTL